MLKLMLCFTLSTIFVSSTTAETRHALVIGNNNYPGNELRNAVNDATAVYGILKDGYLSTLVLDADRDTLIGAVDHYVDTLKTGDTALLYYAGHGLQVDGENYLVPTDFNPTSQSSVKDQGYSLSTIVERFTAHGATTQIVILDSCRANPFLGGRSIKGGWSAMSTSAGTFLAFGTSPGSTASDDPVGSHGLFTKYLLPLLGQSDLDIEDLFRAVRVGVIQESHAQQVPWIASSLIGTFHIRPEIDERATRLVQMAYPQTRTTATRGRSVDVVSPSGNGPRLNSVNVKQRLQIGRAVALARASHLSEAIAVLQDVLSIWPESSVALRLLGLLLHCVGRDTEALSAVSRAVQLNNKDAPAAAYLCVMQGLLRIPGAKAQCELGVTNSPTAEMYLATGAALSASGDDQQASNALSTSISLRPNGLAYDMRGDIEAREGMQQLARDDYLVAKQLTASEAVP